MAATPATPNTADLTGATSSNSKGSLFSSTTSGLQTIDVVITNILSDNKKIAFEPYNNQFTLSDGTTGYSALHYATKIETLGLDALGNVNISNIADNQILSYDNATSKWVNAKLAFDNIATAAVLDSDTMSGASDQTLATSESIKAYVDAQVTAQDLDFQGDTGGVQSIDLDSQTFVYTGGTGISTISGSATLTIQIDTTVVQKDATQTLANKTLTTPVIASLKPSGSNTLTMPDATDTIVGRATTDTFTNKSINADNNTISNIEVDNFKASAIVIQSEGIDNNNNDTTLPTSAAVKNYVDTREAAHDALSELIDVTITSPADGAMLLYDTGTSKWIDNVMSGDATMADTGAITLADGNSTRTNLGLAIGSDVQAYDAGLASISGLTTVANKMIYTTGSDTYAVTNLTATARTLLDDANTSDMRTTLGLAIGSDVQAYDAGLASIAGLTTVSDRMIYTTGSDTYAVTTLTAAGRAILDDADAAAQRTTLGLGATAITGVDDATIEINSSNLRVKADGINDTHIDFGTGTNQVNTDDLTEGSTNLYHTTARARAALSAGTGLTYSSGAFAIDGSVVTESSTDTLTNKTLTSPVLTSPVLNVGVSGTAIKDEDNMVSNSASHLATQQSIKAYVDSVAEGLDVKDSVKVATTANITLANTQTIDGVSLSAGNRVLVKNQSTGSQNGVYVVVSGGSWTRATDFDSSTEVTDGTFFFVEQGTTQADSGWVLTTNNPITVGSTALVFAQFSGAGQITAGTGLSKSGNTLSVDAAQTQITSVGTIGTGEWQGTAIADSYISSASTWNAKQAALTFGKSNTNALKLEENVATNDILLAGSSNVKGRTYSELKSDLTLNNVENTALSTWAGSSNITTVGTLTSATIDGDVTFTGANYNAVWDKSDSALKFGEIAKLMFGTGDDLQIHHLANSFINNETGNLWIKQNADDKDIYIAADDGSGGTTAYITLDGSTGELDLTAPGAVDINASNGNVDISATTGNVIATGNVGNMTFTNTYNTGKIILTSPVVELDANAGNVELEAVGGQIKLTGDTGNAVKVTGNLETTGNIELGNSSDTTLSRASAGVVLIQSNTIITTGNADAGATTTSSSDADHVLINDGGVLKKITPANLGITTGGISSDDATALAIALG